MNRKTTEPVIRSAECGDLEKVLQVQMAAYQIHAKELSPEQIPPLNETIEGVNSDFQKKSILVAEVGGEIVGSIRYVMRTGVCALERLSVDPHYQKVGIGKKLVIEVEHQASLLKAHKIYLETGLSADELIRFYSGLGYSGEAILKNHYGHFDWIVFSKFLNVV